MAAKTQAEVLKEKYGNSFTRPVGRGISNTINILEEAVAYGATAKGKLMHHVHILTFKDGSSLTFKVVKGQIKYL